ncbi:MAG: hypothetical protein Q4C34_05330 [Bacteroidales bacterium]|nr:hypothetical protein [Bacteroidales bacterium]
MKKFLLMVAVAAVAVLGACSGGKESKSCEAGENAVITKLQHCTNPDSISVYVDQAKAYAQKLVNEGKIDEAKAYLDKITPVVQQKAPALVSTLETVKTAISKLPGQVADSTASTIGDVADSIAAKGKDVKDATVEGAKSVYNSAKEVGSKGIDAAKEGVSKAKDGVANTADHAAEAINNALGK